MIMMKMKRDALILRCLKAFKILSRNQLAYLTCRENSNPVNVVNRVLKRMTLEGSILQIPREKDKTYLYMPNPALIHGKSQKVNHHLKIVDVYINFECPEIFTVEPEFEHYRPDIYMKDAYNKPFCIEVQITPISKTKMQQKIDNFVSTFGEHDARDLLIITDHRYEGLKVPEGFKVHKLPIPNEVYS